MDADRVGIVQWRALLALENAGPLGLTLAQWRKSINGTTMYGQGQQTARSLLTRGMAETGRKGDLADLPDDARVWITDAGAAARLVPWARRKYLATR